MFMPEVIRCKDYDELSEKASALVAKEIKAKDGKFSICFPGGSSVKGMLECLAQKKVYWKLVHAFMADERFVQSNSPESNYRQAYELLFSKAKGIRDFPFDMDEGIVRYNKQFQSATNGKIDAVVLGVGEDGHIASLFPNHPSIRASGQGYILVDNAPKFPPKRISLSKAAISQAGLVILLFASESKKQAFENFNNSALSEIKCPAKIALKAKRCVVFTAFGA